MLNQREEIVSQSKVAKIKDEQRRRVSNRKKRPEFWKNSSLITWRPRYTTRLDSRTRTDSAWFSGNYPLEVCSWSVASPAAILGRHVLVGLIFWRSTAAAVLPCEADQRLASASRQSAVHRGDLIRVCWWALPQTGNTLELWKWGIFRSGITFSFCYKVYLYVYIRVHCWYVCVLYWMAQIRHCGLHDLTTWKMGFLEIKDESG